MLVSDSNGGQLCDILELMGMDDPQRSAREWYILPRSNKLFSCLHFAENYPSKCFRSNFRVNREVFDIILESILDDITMKTTNFRLPVPAKDRLAVFLYYCGCTPSYEVTGLMFGLGKTTVKDIVQQVWVWCSLLSLSNTFVTNQGDHLT